jgi:Obg family GTPase CgtA-like protein
VFEAEVERLRSEGHPAFTYEIDEELPPAAQLVRPVSAATGAGMPGLLNWVGPLVTRLREQEPAAAEIADGATPGAGDVEQWSEGGHVTYRPVPTGARSFVVTHDEKTGFAVKGKSVRRLVRRFDLDNEEAIHYLAERLDRLGVYAALKSRGAQPGDEVDIEGYTFEFQ